MNENSELFQALEHYGLHFVPFAWSEFLKMGVVEMTVTYHGQNYDLEFFLDRVNQKWCLNNAKKVD